MVVGQWEKSSFMAGPSHQKKVPPVVVAGHLHTPSYRHDGVVRCNLVNAGVCNKTIPRFGGVFYHSFTRLLGSIYILSPGFISNVSYHAPM